MTKEEQFVEMTENERAKYLDDIRVLGKVKELVLLPNTELMTTKITAEWFEVGEEAIKSVYNRNKKELTQNGAKTIRSTELQDLKTEIQDATLLGRANAVTIFSKRAVLNIAMLLRDSTIAKKIRKALLDQQEIITDRQKTYHIDIKQQLILNIVQATNETERLLALNEYESFNNREQGKLKTTIKKQEPAVVMHKKVIVSKGTDSISNVGKSFGIGEHKFFRFLRAVGIIFVSDGFNVPKQVYQNNGYFVVKMYLKDNQYGTKFYYRTTVTGKGKTALHKLTEKYGGAEAINKVKMKDMESYVDSINEKRKMKKTMSNK